MSERLRVAARLGNDVHFDVPSERDELVAVLADAADHVEQQTAARRRFLERAVCHPGPPLSEHEGYTGEEDLGEHEANILERMDRELRLESDLGTIWRLTEGAMGGTLGIGRTASIDPLDAVRRLLNELADMVNNALAERYPNGGHHEETLPLVERVRREIERGLATLPSREPSRAAGFDVGPAGNAVAEHIRAAGGDPENATVAQIADALNATTPGWTFAPNAMGGIAQTPDQQRAIVSTIEVVGVDQARAHVHGLLQDHLASFDGFIARHKGALNSPETRRRIAEDLSGLLASPPAPAPKVVCVSTEAELARGEAHFEIRGASVPATAKPTSFEEACAEWAEALADEFRCTVVAAQQVVAIVGAELAREVLAEAFTTGEHPVTIANRVAAKP